jgi:hypothetical protein
MTFAEFLKRELDRLTISPYEAARRTGLSHNAIYRHLWGGAIPVCATLRKYRDGLGLDTLKMQAAVDESQRQEKRKKK